MRLWKRFWTDECGAVMSAEVVMLATLGVVGASVGMNMAKSAVSDEMKDVAYALRSLDQSYEFQGYSSSKAWTAGSCYRQRPVEESLAELNQLDREALPKDAGPDGKPVVTPNKKVDGVDSSATPERKPARKKKPKADEDDESSEAVPVERSNDA